MLALDLFVIKVVCSDEGRQGRSQWVLRDWVVFLDGKRHVVALSRPSSSKESELCDAGKSYQPKYGASVLN